MRSAVENLGGCGVVDTEFNWEGGGEGSWGGDTGMLEVLPPSGDEGDVANGVAICSKRGVKDKNRNPISKYHATTYQKQHTLAPPNPGGGMDVRILSPHSLSSRSFNLNSLRVVLWPPAPL